MTWETKDGKILDIKDMDNTHIENVIKHLEKKLESGNTIRQSGGITQGGAESDDIWYDEIDMSEEYIQQIRDFKLELLWRDRLAHYKIRD